MGLLLDTHYVFAIAVSPGRLSPREHRVLADDRQFFLVSAVSIWEIRLKWEALHATGDRKGPRGPDEIVKLLLGQRLTFIAVTPAHAAATLAVGIPHHDPFDALLLVQAQEERHRLLTRDAKLLNHPLAVAASAL
jgi:PIN domain nuclease of toxin-antitoxin system